MTLCKLTLLLLLFSANQAALAVPDTMESNVRPVIIIGASYAASWPIDTLAGHPVVNKGIDGNQSFEMVERFDRDVFSEKPDKILIWGFINDIFRADMNELDATKDRVRSGYKEMVEAAEVQGIEVILATEVSISEPAGFKNWAAGVIGGMLGKTSYQDMINGHVHEVNVWLKDYAESEGIQVLDFEILLAGSDGKRKSEFASDDGSHLTSAAYEAMTAYTKDVLNVEYSANEVN